MKCYLPAPNPRVQRTRPCASLRGSPLTRHPLGRDMLVRGQGVAAAVVIAAISTVHCQSTQPAQPITPVPLELLSGEWIGTVGFRQIGACSMGGNPELADNETRAPITVLLKVEPDGKLAAWEKTRKDAVLDPTKPRWTGSVTKELRISAVKRSEAECSGAKVETKTEMKGSAFEGKTGDSIQVSGRENACPSMGCAFAITYRLTRRSQ
jgi:hypothetical protein